MESINLNQLKHFYTVATYESYTKASQHLNIQQPALSKTIRNLEEDLKSKLFEKSGRNIKLTRMGERIFQDCHNIFKSIDDIILYTKEEELPFPETFRICCNDAVAAKLLPNFLKELSSHQRQTRPVIITGTASSLIDSLEKKESDLGLFFHTPKLPKSLKLTKIPVQFKLVISKKHLKSEHVLSSFIGSREVDNEKTHTFPTVSKMRNVWPKIRIKMSSNSFLTHKEMVLNGLGVSILPEFLVSDEIKSGKLSTLLNDENFVFDLKVVSQKESTDSQIEPLLLEALKNLI
ncbi:MAG: LysR family transcriptional regulator [Bdellovibrionales bacterium]